MRLIKMFGLAALAAVAAMAFVGASSAMASESTQLCWAHETPCLSEATLLANKVEPSVENQVGIFKMLAETTELLTSLATILCLQSHVELEVESPNLAEAPLALHVSVTKLEWLNCGTTKEHNNCEVKNLKLPLFDVLKTALNLGTAIALGAEVLVNCTKTIVGTIHCIYGGAEVKGFTVEGALHNGGAAGHGMFTASKLLVPKVEGGFACPKESKWDALYEPEKHLYLVS